MRVIFNRLVAMRQRTGIGHYAEHLFRALQARAAPDRVDGYPAGLLGRLCRGMARARLPLEGKGAGVVGPSGAIGRWRRGILGRMRHGGRALLAAHFRGILRRHGFDLYHEPNFLPWPTDAAVVTTLHDLSVLRHPEWHPADRVRHFERELPRVVHQCAHFITVSQFVRREVIESLGIPAERVTAVPNGIRPGLQPVPAAVVRQTLRRLGLPAQYLLYVGTIEPRKNVLTLLRAYCGLPAPLRQRWPLVLAGAWGWGAGAVASYWRDHARHQGVWHAGYVRERDLAAVYSGARALAYPSHYEGFGLPPLEMLACGGAVLASTAGAIAEMASGHAHLIAPGDMDGWRAALARVATDDNWWQSLRRGSLSAVRSYTWDRCAAETLAIYRRVAGTASVNAPPLPASRAAG